jgi:hypothetical protein
MNLDDPAIISAYEAQYRRVRGKKSPLKEAMTRGACCTQDEGFKPMLIQAAWAAIRVRGRPQARYNRLVRGSLGLAAQAGERASGLRRVMARTHRLGDNAGMARDDGRAQVPRAALRHLDGARPLAMSGWVHVAAPVVSQAAAGPGTGPPGAGGERNDGRLSRSVL